MENQGQQVFIVHPNPVHRQKLVNHLRNHEYETFGASSEKELGEVNGGEGVVFVGEIDDVPSGEILEHSGSAKWVAIGSHGLPEGYDDFLPGDDELDEILEYLESIGARGHRHFVRFGGEYAAIATFDFLQNGRHYAGVIHDISVAGFSCTFRPEPEALGSPTVDDMRLNLPGYQVAVAGRFTARRKRAGQAIRVFMFTGEIPGEIRDCIYDFIYASLEMKLSPH